VILRHGWQPTATFRNAQHTGTELISPIADYVLELERNNPDREIAVLIPELVERP